MRYCAPKDKPVQVNSGNCNCSVSDTAGSEGSDTLGWDFVMSRFRDTGSKNNFIGLFFDLTKKEKFFGEPLIPPFRCNL